MKKLIIAPHADDEALGCSAFLDKDAYTLIASINDERLQELLNVAQNLHYTPIFMDEEENNLDLPEVIRKIEYWVANLRPNMILIPHTGFHQDHQVLYNAALAALRPHEYHFFVKKVIVYEVIQDFVWADKPFVPNYFIPIDIEKKILAFSFYKSQMQSHRSIDTIKQIAALRGAMSNVPYAEAYKIIRWVD